VWLCDSRALILWGDWWVAVRDAEVRVVMSDAQWCSGSRIREHNWTVVYSRYKADLKKVKDELVLRCKFMYIPKEQTNLCTLYSPRTTDFNSGLNHYDSSHTYYKTKGAITSCVSRDCDSKGTKRTHNKTASGERLRRGNNTCPFKGVWVLFHRPAMTKATKRYHAKWGTAAEFLIAGFGVIGVGVDDRWSTWDFSLPR
jgi:hypothetical protein